MYYHQKKSYSGFGLLLVIYKQLTPYNHPVHRQSFGQDCTGGDVELFKMLLKQGHYYFFYSFYYYHCFVFFFFMFLLIILH